ncbi:hypothetical protein SNEBB_003224 [Seison nebaliae]|nr:hypothetical protein SNEBB_003224 [Seison nebaliae]
MPTTQPNLSIDTNTKTIQYTLDGCQEQTAQNVTVSELPTIPFLLIEGIETRYQPPTSADFDYAKIVGNGTLVYIDNVNQYEYMQTDNNFQVISSSDITGKFGYIDSFCLLMYNNLPNNFALLFNSEGKVLHYVKSITFNATCEIETDIVYLDIYNHDTEIIRPMGFLPYFE